MKKCPLCNGKGLEDVGPYWSPNVVACRFCEGKGEVTEAKYTSFNLSNYSRLARGRW